MKLTKIVWEEGNTIYDGNKRLETKENWKEYLYVSSLKRETTKYLLTGWRSEKNMTETIGKECKEKQTNEDKSKKKKNFGDSVIRREGMGGSEKKRKMINDVERRGYMQAR